MSEFLYLNYVPCFIQYLESVEGLKTTWYQYEAEKKRVLALLNDTKLFAGYTPLHTDQQLTGYALLYHGAYI